MTDLCRNQGRKAENWKFIWLIKKLSAKWCTSSHLLWWTSWQKACQSRTVQLYTETILFYRSAMKTTLNMKTRQENRHSRWCWRLSLGSPARQRLLPGYQHPQASLYRIVQKCGLSALRMASGWMRTHNTVNQYEIQRYSHVSLQ